MNFQEIIADRYSVRKFQDKKLPKDVIDKIVKAGHLAPTACNLQPQRILVIDDSEALAKLKECTRCHFDAPAAMLICCDKTECWVRKYDGKSSGEIDASIVTTYMMLAAWDVGVGTTWVMHFNPQAMREKMGVPDNLEPVALLVMGYADVEAKPYSGHYEFKDIGETVFYNTFD